MMLYHFPQTNVERKANFMLGRSVTGEFAFSKTYFRLSFPETAYEISINGNIVRGLNDRE